LLLFPNCFVAKNPIALLRLVRGPQNLPAKNPIALLQKIKLLSPEQVKQQKKQLELLFVTRKHGNHAYTPTPASPN